MRIIRLYKNDTLCTYDLADSLSSSISLIGGHAGVFERDIYDTTGKLHIIGASHCRKCKYLRYRGMA